MDLKWSYPNLAVKPPEYDLLVERKKYGTNRWGNRCQSTVSDNSWSDKNVEPDTLYWDKSKISTEDIQTISRCRVSTRTGFPLNTQLTGCLSSNRIRLEWDMTNNFEGTVLRMDAAGNYRPFFLQAWPILIPTQVF